MKILFVCSANVDRSPTAECLYGNEPGLEVKSAGASPWARKPVSAELIEWADVVLCMEDWQKQFIEREFREVITKQKIGNLDIRDTYRYMQPLLIEIIKEKTDAWLLENQCKQS